VRGVPGVKGNSKRIVQNRKTGAAFLIGDSKARKREKDLVSLLSEHAPPAPLEGPLRMDVVFVMPIPKSMSKWRKAAALDGRGVYPSKRPDRGNLLKLLEDALEACGFYRDDSQIVDGVVAKAYGETPGTRVWLTQLEEATRVRTGL